MQTTKAGWSGADLLFLHALCPDRPPARHIPLTRNPPGLLLQTVHGVSSDRPPEHSSSDIGPRVPYSALTLCFAENLREPRLPETRAGKAVA